MEDFRFTLMRHWTLYDAMLHSTYVAARMHTYTDKGQRKLNDLLAKMGFRIKDCKHDYGVHVLLLSRLCACNELSSPLESGTYHQQAWA